MIIEYEISASNLSQFQNFLLPENLYSSQNFFFPFLFFYRCKIHDATVLESKKKLSS